MVYPLIILGAGASSDFLVRSENPSYDPDLDQFIPPLTSRLFDGTKFHEIINRYSEMHRLVDYIRLNLRSNSPKRFEEVMTNLYQEKIKVDDELYPSFMSVLFYLSDLFMTISDKYFRGNNNYGGLIKMLGFYGNKAIFVNFNYDLLLEKSLEKSNIKFIDELIDGNFPVIKIHGGCNWYWARPVSVWDDNPMFCYDLSLSNAKYLLTTETKDQKIVIHNLNPRQAKVNRIGSSLSGYSYHPALALPIEGKNNYICPEAHIDFLKKELIKIDRIIIAGWRIGDPFLKELILQELRNRKIPIFFIGGKNSKNIIEDLEEEFKSNIYSVEDTGFSSFLSNSAEDFLARDLENKK